MTPRLCAVPGCPNPPKFKVCHLDTRTTVACCAGHFVATLDQAPGDVDGHSIAQRCEVCR